MEQGQFGFFKEAIIDNDGALIVTATVSGSTNDLNGVLAQGNETNGYNILLTDGDSIRNSINPNNLIQINSDQIYIDVVNGVNYSEIGISTNDMFLLSTDGITTTVIEFTPISITLNTISLLLPNLPTSNPNIVDAIYRDGDFLKVSNG